MLPEQYKKLQSWVKLVEMPYANIGDCPYCGYHIGLYDAKLELLTTPDKDKFYRDAVAGKIPFPVKCPNCGGIFDWFENKPVPLSKPEQEKRTRYIVSDQ